MRQAIILATEGMSDIAALQAVIEHIARQYNINCSFTVFCPELDETSGLCRSRGWTGLMNRLKKVNPHPVPEMTEEDKAIWSASGMMGPVVTPSLTWATIKGVDNGMLVIQIDGDIVHELGQYHPCGDFSQSGMTVHDYCISALRAWSGLTEQEDVFAVAIQCLETWFWAALSEKKDIEDFESVSNPLLSWELLFCNCPGFYDFSGNYSVDKEQLSSSKSDKLADNWEKVCERCPSAKIFTENLKAQFKHRIQQQKENDDLMKAALSL